MKELEKIPKELEHLKLQKLYYCGNLELMSRRKITIIGSRNPNVYAQSFTKEIASRIVQCGGVVVSGGALGVDIIAHASALPSTIMVSPSSLDIIYPKTNQKIIQRIYQESLIFSQFPPSYFPRRYSFLERNKLVVGFGECVIIPQADSKSGSMQSARYALKMGKKIYVPPHRLRESEGTQRLAKNGYAKVIWDIDSFMEDFFGECLEVKAHDEILEFCQKNPFFEEAFLKFGEILFEYELEGKIRRINGRIEVV
ncbi:MAG: DNA-protecting protein DprA [Helicobacter sp.]|nr:DNA-protecting protein DprA [Helicobacter sp.]